MTTKMKIFQRKPSKRVPLPACYHYHDIISYIEKKYEINTRDYLGKFARSWKKHPEDEKLEYLDFWHWVIADNDDANNGSMIYIRLEESEDNPPFVNEILALIRKEFPREGEFLHCWVEW